MQIDQDVEEPYPRDVGEWWIGCPAFDDIDDDDDTSAGVNIWASSNVGLLAVAVCLLQLVKHGRIWEETSIVPKTNSHIIKLK